ncbi:phage protein NinX family protein [Enterobacter cloacae]|uniref:phage protein NinX family protein n=1 Tax=Enterobacter cloacae TaxID=550 RepID=UPI002A814103|nr:phage protein NinX family protein [Enterobacter cloacae]
MNYSQLSDFEINKRIAIALNIDMHFFIPESENSFDLEVLPSEMGPIWQTSAHMVLQYSPSNGNCFNPCNNPADAWPIITDNKISIYAAVLCDSRGMWGAEASFTDHYHFHNNALRAAMIVFLMMQDANHA